jgi:hypothetical protein
MTTSASLSEMLDRKISDTYRRYSTGELSEDEANREIAHLHAQRRPFDRRHPRSKGERHRCTREPGLRRVNRRFIGRDLPERLASKLTPAEQSVAATIFRLAKRNGGLVCDRSNPEISDISNSSITKVQDTLYILKRDGDIDIKYRPQKGGPNLTNIVIIKNKEVLAWMARGPRGEGSRTDVPQRQDKKESRFFVRPAASTSHFRTTIDTG